MSGSMGNNDVIVSSQPLIPIFKGENNYCLWSLKMKTLFKSQELWDMVEQGYGEPKETPSQNRKKDAKALLFIQSAVDDVIFQRISAASTSKQAWEIIQKEYSDDKKTNAQHKQEEHGAATGMEEELYKAAIGGSIEAMRGISNWKDQQTPTGNNVLHLHVGKSSGFKMVGISSKRYATVDSVFVEYVVDDGEGYWLLWKQNNKGDTPLHLAARFGHSKAVKAFLEQANKVYQSADEVTRLLSITNTNKDLALHEAARAGHTEVVEMLVQADPYCSTHTQPNDHAETPLYLAAERGCTLSVLAILPTCRASHLAYKGPCGRTPLHAAVQWGSPDMVERMLEKDRSLMCIQDEEGLTPLHSAAAENGNIDLLKILLRESSSLAYMQDNKGRTALHIAMLRRNVKALDALIESCPDCIEIVDHKGQNVLHCAAKWGFQDVINWFARRALHLDKYINDKNNDGDTPLHILSTYVEENPDEPFVMYRLKPFLLNFPSLNNNAFNELNRTAGDVLHSIARSWNPSENDLLFRFGRGRRENQYEREINIDAEIAMNDGDEWDIESLKKLGETRLVVATLIATISFAAAITVPGGSDQNVGKNIGMPVLKGNTWFKVFIFFDGIAFVTSSIAILYYFILVTTSKTATRARSLVGVFMNSIALGALMIAFIAALGAITSSSIRIMIILITMLFFPFYFFILSEVVGGHFFLCNHFNAQPGRVIQKFKIDNKSRGTEIRDLLVSRVSKIIKT